MRPKRLRPAIPPARTAWRATPLQLVAEGDAAPVGHEHRLDAVGAQAPGESQRGDDMAAGAARSDGDVHGGAPAPGRHRVSARMVPAVTATASSDDPP